MVNRVLFPGPVVKGIQCTRPKIRLEETRKLETSSFWNNHRNLVFQERRSRDDNERVGEKRVRVKRNLISSAKKGFNQRKLKSKSCRMNNPAELEKRLY